MEYIPGGRKIELVKGDITAQDTEAVVNAANNQLAPGGGVAGAIHRAAGPELWKECSKLGGCPTGEARISKGYNLPNRYVIHTVGPVYRNSPDDPLLLASCYRSSLELAERNGIKTISFPALSTGIFGYPAGDAAKVALSTIIDYLKKSTVITLVRMVLYDEASLRVHEEVLKDLTGGK
ncbi:MAG TPA: O-acetyl-ADP-ribose deacetylase [Desulfomonilia bacterium]|jgi:O-acetyl-ADP-ribose deacetylase (regulator of RNase III)